MNRNILEIFKEIISGRIKVSSTSKIKKIIATKKKWRENGRRAEVLGSNPHSKGLLFSRSEKLFLEIKFKIPINNIKIKIIIKEEYRINRITYAKGI